MWARFCHLADDGCSTLPCRKASQTFSAPWIPSCTPPLCPVQIHITQNTSSCKYKYMKVEMCVWSSVCMRPAQPNAADESWLHFVMRRAVCILHHHLTVSRSYFAILSRTYLITIIHTHTRKISGDQNSNFIFEQHKKRICLGLSLGCGSAAHWSTIHRAFILWVFETDLVYGWVEQMVGFKWYAECIFTWKPTCMTMNQHSGRALGKPLAICATFNVCLFRVE